MREEEKGLLVFKRFAIAVILGALGASTIVSGAFAAPVQANRLQVNQSTRMDTLTQLPEKLPQWAVDGSPYVQIVDYRAVVSPAIYTSGLSSQTIQDVVGAVNSYNSINVRTRKDGIIRSATSTRRQSRVGASTSVTPDVPPWCTDVVRSNPVWWGWSYWMNHCAGNDLLYGGTAAGAVIALFSGPGAPFIGAAVAVEAADLSWSMSQCSNGSAFWNFPYSGGWWFAPGC